jgi:hypothetical protein
MKLTITSLFALIAIELLFYACEKNNLSSNGLISHSECKGKSKSTAIETPDSISSIEYSFDSPNGKLSIKHINAAFNCCFDSLFCDIIVNKDTIIIQECETIKQACYCDCLYDLNIEVNDIVPQKYFIKITEPLCGDQPRLNFEIDLQKDKKGSYSVIRKKYPW